MLIDDCGRPPAGSTSTAMPTQILHLGPNLAHSSLDTSTCALSHWASSIGADARPTALVSPGDAEDERLGQREPRIETCSASLALLQAASRGDLLSADSGDGKIASGDPLNASTAPHRQHRDPHAMPRVRVEGRETLVPTRKTPRYC
jgi:hypothetical protein